MHPANCKCSICFYIIPEIMKDYDDIIMKTKSKLGTLKPLRIIIVKNNIMSKETRTLLVCAICGVSVTAKEDNYGIYRLYNHDANPTFDMELCSESCMNMWRLINAHLPIEVIANVK